MCPSNLESRRKAAIAALALAVGLAAAPALAASDTVDVLAVTASSTDGMLMDAVDDDPDTAWQDREGDREAWLAVRFAQPSQLRGIRMLTGPLPAGVSFDVETSPDGGSYHTQIKGHRIEEDRPVELDFPQKASALYVRVRFHYTGSGQPPRFRIRELEALKG
jgi:hypothetical protein